MINVYIIIELIIAIILFSFMIFFIKKHYGKNNSIIEIFGGASITIVISTLSIITTNQLLAYIFHCTYLASTTWLMLILLKHFLEYSYNSKLYQKIKKYLYIFNILDTINILSNIYFHHLYTMDEVMFHGKIIYTQHVTHLYPTHFIYVYLIIIAVLLNIVIKLITSKGIYKTKYTSLLFSYALIIGCNLVCKITASSIEYSVMGYGFLASSIAYYTLYKTPKRIIESLNYQVFNKMKDSIIAFDNEQHIIYKNASAIEILKEIKIDYNNILNKDLLNDEITWNEVIKYKKSIKYLEYTFKKIYDSKNNILGYFLFIHDNTEKIEKQKEEKRKLSRDSLTNIYNKDYFEIKVKELLKNTNKEYYMIYTDIKNFKLINDLYSKKIGDKVLISIAKVLNNKFKHDSEVVYSRISNDNFAILIPVEKYKKNNIKKILDSINKDYSFKIYLYLGLYRITSKNMAVSSMIDNANIALKSIKKNYKIFTNEYNDSYKLNLVKEQTIISSFKNALKNKEFTIYLQPQISNITKNVVGAEALVRWIKDDKIISPGEFIPILEKVDLITELDKYVWEKACQTLAEWKNTKYKNLYISINISPSDFIFTDVHKTISKLVTKYDIDKKKLKLEITESAFISNIKETNEIIDRFRNEGYILEIDDFGSGYSSLNQLKNINVDVVKLDMGFLYEPKNIDKCKIIIEILINLSKQLGLEIIIEGVETEQQYNYLSKIGCDTFQGYYFDKPISIEEFTQKYGGSNEKK